MKISFNWIRQYIGTNLSVGEVADVLTAVGLEVESVEKVEKVPGGLKGVVVGEVLECEKHPDADRLRLTKVNLGIGDPVQIVCGAPNVAAGQKVLVATIGAELHPVSGDPIVIKKGKIRGQESHGMICAEDELGIGHSHEGIMVLDSQAEVGTEAAKFLGLMNDYCLEIGLTPNRTDAFSHYGVARDLFAALRNMEGAPVDQPILSLPDITGFSAPTSGNAISVQVNNFEACPRYAGLNIRGVKVGPSPEWLRDRLTAIGLRSINNVVDVTNYVQHEIGQPLHAFDAGCISGEKIIVRLADVNEKITTLDGIERTLVEEDLVICDTQRPLCIAGVFGGSYGGVTEQTTDVFIESAYFHPVFIRKTARRHGLHTDASFRFERGSDPENVIWALKRAALLIMEIVGGEVVAPLCDLYPDKIEPFKVDFSLTRCKELIGKDLGQKKIREILGDLSIAIVKEQDDLLQLSVPVFRSDVQREADVVEEILRIYGYDNVEIPTTLHTSLSYSHQIDHEQLRGKVADLITANGYHECMSMSLSGRKYLEFAEGLKESVVEILNPLSNDLGVMRQTLLFGGLEAIALNQNHRQPDLRLYEFGKVYHQRAGKYQEEYRLAIWLTGRRAPESWNNNSDAVGFPDLFSVVQRICAALGIADLKLGSSESTFFNAQAGCFSGKRDLGIAGEVKASLLKEFDIKQPVWYAELQWSQLTASIASGGIQYVSPGKFPSVRRDLSLLLDKSIQYSEIEKLALETERKLLKSVNLFDVYEGKNLDAGKKSYAISFVLQDAAKTMTDQQVDQIMMRIQRTLEDKLGASLRTA